MSEPDIVQIATVEQAVAALEFERVDYYRLGIERISATTQKQDGTLNMAFRIRQRTDGLDFRCRLRVSSESARIIVDAAAVFRASGPVLVERPVAERFGEQVGLMTLFPFLREAAADLARRLDLRVSLPLLKHGEIRLAQQQASS